MVNIVFVLHGDNIKNRYRICEANSRLLRLINKECNISIVIDDACELHINELFFDEIYKIANDEGHKNHVSFVASALLRMPAAQTLYLNENLFCLTEIHSAIGRNLTSGVYIPKKVLDFTGKEIIAHDAWNAQNAMERHKWPVVLAPCIWFNNDEKTHEFFTILLDSANSWHITGKEISDSAMQDITLDNLLSFVCLIHPENYQVTEFLNFKNLSRKDNSREINWIHKDWHDWLDTWWVSKDGMYLRIENFRQQGFLLLDGNYIEQLEQWLEKIKLDSWNDD